MLGCAVLASPLMDSARGGEALDLGGAVELVDFLRARLDEVEAACRAARKDGGGCWELLAHERGDGAIYDDMGNPVLEYDTDPETGIPTRYDVNPLGARQAAHIAIHDPDRTLTEVEAWRAVVDFAATYEGSFHASQFLPKLAAVYSEHPDFDPTWLDD